LLAFGEDRLDIALRLSGDAAVLLRQEIHGEVNAVKLAARDGEVARVFGAAGEQKSIIIAFQLLHAHVAPDMHVAMEDDAFGFHLLHAPLDDVFLHFEVGNAIAEESPGLGVLLIDMHLVSGPRELLGGSQACGA
jgi:hypothetical protein